MKCKATTAAGDPCQNSALHGSDYCRVHKKQQKNRPKNERLLYCSFCGKSQHEVIKLIAGPSVYICDDCLDICVDIVISDDSFGVQEDYMPFLSNQIKGNQKKSMSIDELGFKPRFNKLKFEKKDNHCFYLCPFSDPFNSIYSDHVKPIIEKEGFTIDRADEIFGTQPIIEDIWESINSSELIIADVSGKNPNVMYEIGMAHTIGKPVVIMTQDINDVPFDLKHYRCIVYSYTPKGVEALESQIAGTIKFISG